MSHSPRRYPTFSEEEFESRRSKVRKLMDRNDLDVLLVYGDSGTHHHNHAQVHFLTGYLGHGSSYLVFFADPDEPSTLFYGISNHGQYAEAASAIDDVRWGGYPIDENVAERVQASDAANGRIGIVGISARQDNLVPHGHYETFHRRLPGELVDVTETFGQLRYVKSEAEIEWFRNGARLTDRGLEALVDTAAPGATEHDLRSAYEAAFLEEGGDLFVAFIASSPADGPRPGECLPWQEATGRTLRRGDVVTTELSASYHGYPGQIHRPIAVGRPPSATYRDLFEVTHEAYQNVLGVLEPGNTAEDVAEALAPIEESEYKIYDVCFHGFGTSLQPPFVGTSSAHSKYWPATDAPVTANWEFEANQLMTIQPNAVTMDERCGLQLGTTVVIREDGPDVLHDFPVEFVRV